MIGQELPEQAARTRAASVGDRSTDFATLRKYLASSSIMCVLVLRMSSLVVLTSEKCARATAATITVTKNINYGPSTLDLYFPGAKRGALRPAIVLVHGGGWTHRDKNE